MYCPAPRLSVVMPVRNAGPFLDESIGSILAQTFVDFEFVVLDDASTDDSWLRIQAWAARDRRIAIHRAGEGLGMVGSANAVVRLARGTVIARMDADDVSHPERLTRQLAVLEARPEVTAIGTLSFGIDASGCVIRPRDRWRLIQRSPYQPFPHGSAMFPRAAFDAIGGYRDLDEWPEDADFFMRLAAHGPVVALPEALYYYRYHVSNSTAALGDTPPRPGVPRADVDFVAAQAIRVWAGPGTAGAGSNGDMSPAAPRPISIRRWVYSSWGRYHPSSLRAALRVWIRLRDLAAAIVIRDGRVYQWRCG